MISFLAPPNDRRYFVHKRIGGAIKGFVEGGFNPLSALTGFIAPKPPARRTIPRTRTARPSEFSAGEKESGRLVKFPEFAITNRPPVGGGRLQPCRIGFTRNSAGQCVRRGKDLFDPLGLFGPPPGGGGSKPQLQIGPGAEVGEAVMGRYGAALQPGSRIIDRAVCLRGMQLGDDGLCYNRGNLKNSQRMWPRGRRPLLTGGEMRAISVASRAAGRLTRTAVRLQEIGLIKKPVARKPRKKKG